MHVWTINDPAELRALFDLGVDGVVTDLPAVAVAVRDRGAG
jgi:glycerophosphoryl diester phosphodiesterase